jgi:hypothetical protein
LMPPPPLPLLCPPSLSTNSELRCGAHHRLRSHSQVAAPPHQVGNAPIIHVANTGKDLVRHRQWPPGPPRGHQEEQLLQLAAPLPLLPHVRGCNIPATLQNAKSIWRRGLMREARHTSVTRSALTSALLTAMGCSLPTSKMLPRSLGDGLDDAPGQQQCSPSTWISPQNSARPAAPPPAPPPALTLAHPPNNCHNGNVHQGGTKVEVGGDI